MEGYPTLSEPELRRILTGVEGLPTKVEGQDFRLDRHDETLANHAGRIRAVEEAIVTPPDLTALTATVAGHGVRLNGIDATLVTHAGRLDGHDADVSTLSARVDEVTLRVNDLEAMPPRVVYNETQLLAAMVNPGKIWVMGQISVLSGLVSTTDDLDFEGVGTDAGFLLPHNGTSQQIVFWVCAKRNKFRKILFTTNHPLTSGRSFQDIGLRLGVNAGQDCSDLELDDCRFENLAWGILRDGNSSSPVTRGVVINNCKFRDIYMGCIYIRWHCHRLEIINCDFDQRTDGKTHGIEYNPIYVANRCDYGVCTLNRIRHFGRLGIEVWNNSDDPLAADSNFEWEVTFNTVEEPLPFAPGWTPFGITILAKGTIKWFGNVVRDCVVAYEVNGDNVNDGTHIVEGNTAIRSKNQAFSVNCVGGATLKGNLIDRVAVDGFPSIPNNPVGVQIINGGRHIKVHSNDFIDAGRFNVWVAGKSLTITGITNAADAVFTVSSFGGDTTRPSGWYVGKRICLRGVGGMTALNDRYYTMTEVSGLTFKLGVDTSAMPAYTSGGRVQENYVGLSICGNEFYVNDEIDPFWSGPSGFARTIYIHDIQQAMVKSNHRYVNPGLSGYWGSFSIQNYGTVYHDDAGGSVTTTAAELAIAGSNQSITIFPE